MPAKARRLTVAYLALVREDAAGRLGRGSVAKLLSPFPVGGLA